MRPAEASSSRTIHLTNIVLMPGVGGDAYNTVEMDQIDSCQKLLSSPSLAYVGFHPALVNDVK